MSATPSTDPSAAPLARTAPPAWWHLARRPKWIALLVVVLMVAAAFALLAQWQAGRAVETATAVDTRATETAVPLASIDRPQSSVTGEEAGQIVSVHGRLVLDDTVILTDRLRSGTMTGIGSDPGAWVVGHLIDDAGDSVAVALGWTPDAAAAQRAIDRLTADEAGTPQAGATVLADLTVTGRYLASEAPQESDFEAGEHTALATAELVNEWEASGDGGAYAGYVVAAQPILGELRAIIAPPPQQQESLNWLNVFYALEWVLFAGFAFYLWYRLVKDAWEHEVEEAAAPATVE